MTDRRGSALGNLRVLPDEILCNIVEELSPRDVGRLACVSSVFYIICNEEPLWMMLCLRFFEGELDYKGSWKQTAKEILHLTHNAVEVCESNRVFDGFSSLFLYRRWYRCHISLENFVYDVGAIERREDISNEEFSMRYDAKKPVLISGLANDWDAKQSWTLENLVGRYGEVPFRISQSSAKKINMKLKNYVSYMKEQHDEDPLYIFDANFGEVAPELLKDYNIPHLFQEDLFSVLENSKRPPYRWLIIGPPRSGASWHVDPALTSAWNTLLQGRKRWALYPPCRVPPGVTVHVNEEDGDVNIESPSSLQWWLDIYPLLAEHDKPIECIQHPGETIFVPSGWWHCVLNIDASIAVTQNFANVNNFGFVCLDLAPGYRHKGVARSGWLALQDQYDSIHDVETTSGKEHITVNVDYSVDTLALYLDKTRDQYSSTWSGSSVLGQKDVRDWLHKLWWARPEIRDLIWKGADMILNARKWLDAVVHVCIANCLPVPSDSETLPVGHGSNPVYLVGEYAVKFYVEGGTEAALYSLGSELEFYDLLAKSNSPLMNHVPHMLASGVLCHDGGQYESVSWDGKGVPSILIKNNLLPKDRFPADYSFNTWNKMHATLNMLGCKREKMNGSSVLAWPYLITRKCKGEDFAHVREQLSMKDYLELASFLGKQVRHLHSLPLPQIPSSSKRMKLNDRSKIDMASPIVDHQENRVLLSSMNCNNNIIQGSFYKDYQIPAEWLPFVNQMRNRQHNVKELLLKWSECPKHLIEKVEDYLPQDPLLLLNIFGVKNEVLQVSKSGRWLHMDIMDDNIQMEPYLTNKLIHGEFIKCDPLTFSTQEDVILEELGKRKKEAECFMRPSCILDFGDISIGDPIYELLAIYIDVFRGNFELLKCFLSSYNIPLFKRLGEKEHLFVKDADYEKLNRISYHAMCYCILHEDNVMGAIFSIWKELKKANTWEEIEKTVWGKLNDFEALC